MATTFLSTTLGTPTSSRIWTFSTWLKRSGLSSGQHIFSIDNGSQRDAFSFDSDDGLRLYFNGSATGYADLSTNRVLRDTSAFYHLVIAVDTTQGTAANRVKLYINGTQYTWDETTVYGDQNYDTFNASGNTFRIGRDRTAAAYFDGILAHTHFIDGTQYAASTFGETDSTSGIWKPKTAPSVTYGNNGFFLKFENSGNLDLDSSGNNRSFTTSGTLTQNVDTPSNNYAVFNRTDRHPGTTNNYGDYLTLGNTKITIASAQKGCLRSTIGVLSGKYYWEAKVISKSKGFYGVCNSTAFDITSASLQSATSYSGLWYYENGPNYYTYNNNTNNTSIDSIANNDILCFALDMDNYAFYIRKNGDAWMNSGNPTSGASRTGSIAELFTYGRNVLSDKGEVFVNHYNDSGTGGNTAEYNFGSGFFGTTAVASANADANGHGIFEYAVPSGYYTLNTKNLKEFG